MAVQRLLQLGMSEEPRPNRHATCDADEDGAEKEFG